MAPHAEPGTPPAGGVPDRGGDPVTVDSADVSYSDTHIQSRYVYRTTRVTTRADGTHVAAPYEAAYDFRVRRHVGRVGLMLVGWGGNNGSTVTAGILANRRGLSWEARDGHRAANYHGSLVMGSTVRLGSDARTGADVNVPFRDVLPMAHPDDLVLGGWDISGLDLAAAMDRAMVLEPGLKDQVRSDMAAMRPLPSIYYPDFIAANQADRADNLLPGQRACAEHVRKLRADMAEFKALHRLDTLIVMWTANTERYADVVEGVNDTADNLLAAIEAGHPEVSPSTVFAVAAIQEGAPFINGSPQNTFVPGALELAQRHGSFVGGDDFKSGQTKLKSALVDFLIGAGIKLTSIASYNHLGNNDGRNLSAAAQFRSKEISKSTVVDDMVASNRILYPTPQDKPDHAIVIKYLPAAGDSKRALDEYSADIFLGGRQTISLFNICEDSLLAAPLIIDLALVAEAMTRIAWRPAAAAAAAAGQSAKFRSFHSVLSVLSYMLKAPVTPPGTPVVNALAKQRAALVNIFRAVVGLQPESDMGLEHKLI